LAAIATISIASAYAAYRIQATKPDALAIDSQPTAGDDRVPTAAPAVSTVGQAAAGPAVSAVQPTVAPAVSEGQPTAAPAVATVVQSKPPESEAAPVVEAPRLTNNPQTTKRASARQRSVQSSVKATPPAAQKRAPARVAARTTETHKAQQPT